MTDEKSPETLLEFPCEFLLKIIGRDDGTLVDVVHEVLLRHLPGLSRERLSTRPSQNGRFLAISVRFVAESRAQLDALYGELGALDEVHYVL